MWTTKSEPIILMVYDYVMIKRIHRDQERRKLTLLLIHTQEAKGREASIPQFLRGWFHLRPESECNKEAGIPASMRNYSYVTCPLTQLQRTHRGGGMQIIIMDVIIMKGFWASVGRCLLINKWGFLRLGRVPVLPFTHESPWGGAWWMVHCMWRMLWGGRPASSLC